MDPADPSRAARRSAGEWLFQLTTITIGVLIALSFDAVLRWNADRALVAQARATIALEVDANRRDLEGYIAAAGDRMAKLDTALKLVGELDAGVDPTVREVDLRVDLPSLNSAGWQTAERTGALALMQYADVQQLAEMHTLQALFTDTLKPSLVAVTHAAVLLNATGDPYEMPPATREVFRARLLEVRASLAVGDQLAQALADSYKTYQAGRGPDTPDQ